MPSSRWTIQSEISLAATSTVEPACNVSLNAGVFESFPVKRSPS